MDVIIQHIENTFILKGHGWLRVLVTAGPTRESIDPVRLLPITLLVRWDMQLQKLVLREEPL